MRRTALVALAVVAFALPTTAGQAATGAAAGLCQIGGRVDYSPTVKTLPAQLSYQVNGTLHCIENVQVGSSVGLKTLTGFFQGSGNGQIGCLASYGLNPLGSGGTFTMGISTSPEATTRDLWEGTFSNAGLSVQALVAQITSIRHQTLVNNVWTNTGPQETIVASAAGGDFVFGVEADDATTCSGPGISNRTFLGHLGYAYVTS
jgi:hypothetical protein